MFSLSESYKTKIVKICVHLTENYTFPRHFSKTAAPILDFFQTYITAHSTQHISNNQLSKNFAFLSKNSNIFICYFV